MFSSQQRYWGLIGIVDELFEGVSKAGLAHTHVHEDKDHTPLNVDLMTASMKMSIFSLSVKLSKGILEIAFSLFEKLWNT